MNTWLNKNYQYETLAVSVMKRKTIFYTFIISIFLGTALLWFGETRSTGGYRVLLIGIDGGSWDILRRLASQNKVPNMKRLIESGSAGYLDSLAWRKKTTGGYGYFSPIIWSTIATGKLPSKHGIEDFKLPLPSSVAFRMGYQQNQEPVFSSLHFPFTNRDAMVLSIRARAPSKIKQLRLQIHLNNRPIGVCQLQEQYSTHDFKIPPELVSYSENTLTFSYSENRRIADNFVGVEVEYLRVHHSSGQEILDYHPVRNKKLFKQGWLNDPPTELTQASSYHFRTRTIWEILSNFQKRLAVIGWWATWPAYKVNGFMVTNHVGLHGERSGHNFLNKLPDLTYPADYIDEIKPLYLPKERMAPDFSNRFFELGKCPCVGFIQERIVLTRFWQDKYFGDIARQLLREKGKFDLFAIYFRGTDTMAHQFIGFSENPGLVEEDCGNLTGCDVDRLRSALGNYYSFVDFEIGEILKRLDKKTITIIVTDHGEAAVGNKGMHQNNGFIIISGPGIRKTEVKASVVDITPTVLYLLDLPVAQDMDGTVLKNVFERELLLNKPLRYIDSYDRMVPGHTIKIEVDQELDEQDTEELKALGYIN